MFTGILLRYTELSQEHFWDKTGTFLDMFLRKCWQSIRQIFETIRNSIPEHFRGSNRVLLEALPVTNVFLVFKIIMEPLMNQL